MLTVEKGDTFLWMKYDKTRVIHASNQEKGNWYLVPAVPQNWLKQILCLTLKLSYLHGTTSSFDYKFALGVQLRMDGWMTAEVHLVFNFALKTQW